MWFCKCNVVHAMCVWFCLEKKHKRWLPWVSRFVHISMTKAIVSTRLPFTEDSTCIRMIHAHLVDLKVWHETIFWLRAVELLMTTILKCPFHRLTFHEQAVNFSCLHWNLKVLAFLETSRPITACHLTLHHQQPWANNHDYLNYWLLPSSMNVQKLVHHQLHL